ncbi:tetratricopeptide repeat protein 19 homolog, mitochondrial isoform X2 [Euwallacea fornicatus]|uniref:tetratricopeptide repeat protein 19 homolog, mitochondrial isoform X2 n=1 Tax=Euwallacea fornicatus TaxID=995702 RepID=UPI00338F67CC
MLKIAHILCKVAPNRHLFCPIICKTIFKHLVAEKTSLCTPIYPEPFKYNKYFNFKSHSFLSHPAVFAVSILTWLGFNQDEEKESELIMILKRAILCTQREEFEKAEQMLHLALRIAQQQQNRQGILYCYDLMANLAFNTYSLDKAEKLFVSVLQLLLEGGTPKDDIKVIHISLKLARICQLKANIERADIGYKWCLEQIEHHSKDDEDTKLLYGVINDWYAQYLLDIGNSAKALIHLNEAYKVCNEIEGINSEKCMLLLNDLGITSFRAEDYDRAEKFLQEAVNVGRKLEDKSHLGVIHANLGLILLQKGVYQEAEKFCNEGKKLEVFRQII